MTEILEPEAIDSALAGTGWSRAGDSIVLEGEERDFVAAWAFASRVAEAAEAAGHHPDILVHGWNKWQITLSTHSAGGVTAADIKLARTISGLATRD